MRRIAMAAGAVLTLLCTSCGGGPSAQDINDSLDTILRSVGGDWTGTGSPGPIRLAFHLQEASNGQLTGTGTMQEDATSPVVPITLTGSYQRPQLTLVIDGMVYESRQVKGSVQGQYTTVGGVGTTLTLTAPGFVRTLPILLQEK